MYIVFTSFILFSSFIKLETCVYVFPPTSPDIKRNLIYYAFGVPPTPLNFREGSKTYMQQIRHTIPRIGVILTACYNFFRFLMLKYGQGEKTNLTL